METCLGDLQLNWCIIYLDDTIVFTIIAKEHLERLQVVFTKLRGAGLKLKPKKCDILQNKDCVSGPCSVQGWSPNRQAQNSGCEEVACSSYCNRGQVLPGVCQLQPSVPEGVCLSCLFVV